MVALALFQPDMAQNVGTLLRMGACLSVPIHIIMPCGFPWEIKRLRRSGLDYLESAAAIKHASWEEFKLSHKGRTVLLSTKGSAAYTRFSFEPGDILLLGRESSGVPEEVRKACDEVVTIPMAEGMRSLNVALAGAMVLGEAIRQTKDIGVTT